MGFVGRECSNSSFFDPCKVAFFHEDFTFIEAFEDISEFCELKPITFLRDPKLLRLAYARRMEVREPK